MTKTPALRDVRATLAEYAPGITIRKEDCGEYRVTFTQAAISTAFPAMTRPELIEKAESLAVYESDIFAAYETGKAMHRTGLAPVAAPVDEIQTDAKGRQFIDCTPTWQAVVPVFIAALESGTETGRNAARIELTRMARLADERNELAARLTALEAA